MENKQLQLSVDNAYWADVLKQDNPVRAGNNNYGYYAFHSITTWNYITVNGIELYGQYETGAYDYHDYDCPSNDFSLNFEYSNKALCILDDLCEKDIKNETAKAIKTLNEIKELVPAVDTLSKLLELFLFYVEVHPSDAREFLDDGHSTNIDDYEELENGELVLIKKDEE